jgi:hypothetical protein
VRCLRKKGYYFIIDAIIGSTIIFLSLMIIISDNSKPARIQYNYEMAEEFSTFVLNTKLEDVSNPYITQLITAREINNTKLTIMEQINLFYYQGKIGYAGNITHNLTESLVPEKYGFSYSIKNDTTTTKIYSRRDSELNTANVIIASKKVTFLQINSTTMFGPAMVEIKIWI